VTLFDKLLSTTRTYMKTDPDGVPADVIEGAILNLLLNYLWNIECPKCREDRTIACVEALALVREQGGAVTRFCSDHAAHPRRPD
jgi:hypothetical protein